MSIELLIVILLAAIALITLVRRFSSNRYGIFRPSMETTQSYLAFRFDPALSYRISGSDVYPNAIIGVEPAWTLKSDLWKPVAMDGQKMRELVENMKSLGVGSGVLPYGYELFDDREVKIGNWFSLPGQNVTIWIRGEKEFELSTPDNLYGQK